MRLSMLCPICNYDKIEQLLNLNCGNLDKSFLYDPVSVVNCHKCGHVYNELSNNDKENIIRYYEEEYSLNNICSPNTKGDLPGSSNENSLARYSLLFDFIKDYLNINHRILDIGCATGGFLHYLNIRGYTKLHGIDFSRPYIEMAKQDEKLDIKEGLAENIPYNENFFDFLTADQVVEHLFDPNRIFAEAKRILKREGLFCISVPDAMMYDDNYFFDFYWFLIREHIQHFDSIHLELLAKKHGFELIKVSTTFTPMISNKTILPNMSLLFKLTQTTPKNSYEDNNHFRLREETKNYIQHCYSELNQKRIIINNILKHNKPIYIFGVSREFLYLYNNTNLYKCNILELIDDTPNKQKFYTVKGRKIIGRAILKDSTNCVLITAFAHTAKIIEVLKSLNFKGEILEI